MSTWHSPKCWSVHDSLVRIYTVFQNMCKLASCLQHLLPPPRNTSAISRLRSSTPLPRPTSRTKKVRLFTYIPIFIWIQNRCYKRPLDNMQSSPLLATAKFRLNTRLLNGTILSGVPDLRGRYIANTYSITAPPSTRPLD